MYVCISVCMYVCMCFCVIYAVTIQQSLPLCLPCTTYSDPAVRPPSPDPLPALAPVPPRPPLVPESSFPVSEDMSGGPQCGADTDSLESSDEEMSTDASGGSLESSDVKVSKRRLARFSGRGTS